ncbi:hypothetical protein GBA52_028431 [Prunus armeniaca]|nr:hypothetical protein GBA52_028431 [Prunus armeniaca]
MGSRSHQLPSNLCTPLTKNEQHQPRIPTSVPSISPPTTEKDTNPFLQTPPPSHSLKTQPLLPCKSPS